MTDIPLMKRQIEAQIDEYAAEIEAYANFMREWRGRHDGYDPVTGEIYQADPVTRETTSNPS